MEPGQPGLESWLCKLTTYTAWKKGPEPFELQISHLKNVENSIFLAEMLRIKY